MSVIDDLIINIDGGLWHLLVSTNNARESYETEVLFAGVPHSTTEDDVYKGYFIPKETIVIGNVW